MSRCSAGSGVPLKHKLVDDLDYLMMELTNLLYAIVSEYGVIGPGTGILLSYYNRLSLQLQKCTRTEWMPPMSTTVMTRPVADGRGQGNPPWPS